MPRNNKPVKTVKVLEPIKPEELQRLPFGSGSPTVVLIEYRPDNPHYLCADVQLAQNPFYARREIRVVIKHFREPQGWERHNRISDIIHVRVKHLYKQVEKEVSSPNEEAKPPPGEPESS